MQGTSFHPAHSSYGALNSNAPAANATQLQFARQAAPASHTHHTLHPSWLFHTDRLTITHKKPHESKSDLHARAQEAKDAPLLNAQPHRPSKIATLAQLHGPELVLKDFTLKQPKTGNWKRHEPVKLSAIQPGQVLIHNRTGREIKVTSVLTRPQNGLEKRMSVQGEIVHPANGQTELRPTKVKAGYLFEFKGVVLNPRK